MAEKYTVTSPEAPMETPNFETLPEFFLTRAKEHAQNGKSYFAIYATTKEKRYYDKFDEESRKIASALYKYGLRKNGYVIYMPTEMIKLQIFLNGVWRANGVTRASYPDDEPEILASRIKETECAILLCGTKSIEACKEAIKNIDWPVHIITTEKCEGYQSIDDILENDDGKSCPALEVTGDDPAVVLCTSGTTGPPKGAVLNHKTLVKHLYLYSLLPFSNKSNLLFSSAVHYSGSLYPFCYLLTGKNVILTGNITKELLHQTISELKPGTAHAFPSLVLSLASDEAVAKGYDFSSLEYLITGSAMVTPAMRKALMTKLPNLKDIIVIYGLSECGVIVTNGNLQPKDPENPTYPGLPDFAVGRPFPGVSIQIRHIETMEPLGPNEKGEICFKYPGGFFHSYYKNPEATKKSFVDGYMRTGDIGYYDEPGFIYVVDRLKEIFKYYSYHISPSDLENVINQHPIVDEVCVVGVPDPGGEVPRAVVTIKGGNSKDPDLVKDILEFSNARLPAYKQLRGGLFIIPELPKGKTGKIMRSLVSKEVKF